MFIKVRTTDGYKMVILKQGGRRMTSWHMQLKKEYWKSFVRWVRRNDAMPIIVIGACVVATIILLCLTGFTLTDAYVQF